jgi:hypothetical protein
MNCGYAAEQCGKAQPFRNNFLMFLPEAKPQEKGRRASDGKAEPYRTVRRQSRNRPCF